MTYGQRKFAVQQAKHTQKADEHGGQKHSLPLRVNQAGVMPCDFCLQFTSFSYDHYEYVWCKYRYRLV